MAVQSSAAAASSPLPSSLAAQLEVATPILLANSWTTKPQLDHIRMRVINAKDPVPSAGRTLLAQFLIDNRLLPRDQVSDLDAIIRNQGTLPQFQLQRKIGAGGMGTVFLAKHIESGRLVALKTINARLADDKDFVERFHREARALERVHNEHIAEIIASGETDGCCWLAMEYIDGPSLMSLLKEHRVLPERYALHLICQVAEGLGHVWDKAGLVHRDIKPENVLVIRSRAGDELFPSTDTAKLIDFGLVKSNNDDERLTQTGMTIGTPLYMSPEQVRGEKLDCRSDIYGLGATLYHLLTGTTPFNGSSPGAIMSAHLTEAVPDPGDRVPSLSKITRQLVMTAMAKPVDQRYVTFDAFISNVTEALDGMDSKSPAAPRLLRKPLVMKSPQVKRSGEYNADGHDVNAPPAPTTKPRTDRATHNPHAATVVTPVSSPIPPPRHAPPLPSPAAPPAPSPTTQGSQRTANQRAPGPGTQRTPVPGTQRPTGQSNRRPVVSGNGASGRSPAALASSSSDQLEPPSAAYSEPPSPGVGMLPWVVFGFAILALVVFIAVSYL